MNTPKSISMFFYALILCTVVVMPGGLVLAQSGDMAATFEKSTKIWNEGNMQLIDEVYAADAIRHGADGEEVAGTEAFKAYITQVRTIYPDFFVVLNNQFVSGDMIAVHWTVSATNKGALSEEIPATGKSVEISGVTIAKYKEGKIAEEWVFWNHGGMGSVMTQLGFTLAPPMMAGKQ
jgi:steroid delta-isomerase-like uncharacterized protein